MNKMNKNKNRIIINFRMNMKNKNLIIKNLIFNKKIIIQKN